MKITKIITLTYFTVFLSCLSGYSLGEDVESFPGLKKLTIQADFDKSQLINIYYNPALANIINQDITNPDSQIFTINVLDIYLDESKSKKFNVIYSEGFSADPQFIVKPVNSNIEPTYFTGTNIYIPGNAAIYISGHTNNYFNEHRKFVFTNEKFIETKQPYLYVGLKTTTLKDIKIYSDKYYKNIVANITKNSKITVLLADKNDYLLKTNFGLVGWFHNDDQSGTDISIRDLYYNGD